MAYAAKLFRTDPAERRSSERDAIGETPSTLRGPDAQPMDILVHDLSDDGFRASCAAPLEIGNLIQIGLSGGGRAQARVIWREADEYGCAFTQPLDPAVRAAAFSGSSVVSPWSPSPAPRTNMVPGGAAAIAGHPDRLGDEWSPRAKALFMIGSSCALWALIALPWLL